MDICDYFLNGSQSKARNLPGGGPQGGTLGIEEYLSQSNGNTDFLDPEEKFKFIDDLSILEILNPVCIGLSSYNCHAHHCPSDIGVDKAYLDRSNINSQAFLDKVSEWT